MLCSVTLVNDTALGPSRRHTNSSCLKKQTIRGITLWFRDVNESWKPPKSANPLWYLCLPNTNIHLISTLWYRRYNRHKFELQPLHYTNVYPQCKVVYRYIHGWSCAWLTRQCLHNPLIRCYSKFAANSI